MRSEDGQLPIQNPLSEPSPTQAPDAVVFEPEKKESAEALKQRFHALIDEVVTRLESPEISLKDFRLISRDLQAIARDNREQDIVDRAWGQAQVNRFIDAYENTVMRNPKEESYLVLSTLSTGRKRGKEQASVSELTAKAIIQRIENGQKLSFQFEKEIEIWCNNIQMVDDDIRLELLVTMMNNPGLIDRQTAREAVVNMGLYGRDFVRKLKSQFEESPDDVSQALTIINAIYWLRELGNQAGFGDSGDEAGQMLTEIRTETTNFFVRRKIDQLLDRQKIKPLHDQYDNKELRKTHSIEPLCCQGYYDKEEHIGQSTYSRVSGRHGAIYTPTGQIDSFFRLSASEESTPLSPERIALRDIIREEAGYAENISEEDIKKYPEATSL